VSKSKLSNKLAGNLQKEELALRLGSWRRYVSPKRQFTFTELHSGVSHSHGRESLRSNDFCLRTDHRLQSEESGLYTSRVTWGAAMGRLRKAGVISVPHGDNDPATQAVLWEDVTLRCRPSRPAGTECHRQYEVVCRANRSKHARSPSAQVTVSCGLSTNIVLLRCQFIETTDTCNSVST
jgi:hypothetical protein